MFFFFFVILCFGIKIRLFHLKIDNSLYYLQQNLNNGLIKFIVLFCSYISYKAFFQRGFCISCLVLK